MAGIVDGLPKAYPSKLTNNYYYFSVGNQAVSTSSTLGTGTLRLAPVWIPGPCTIVRIGADVATIGEAGSKFRIGVYNDTGGGFPGTLLLDAGQIAGDSATIQEVTVSQALTRGLYWFGGAVQTVVTTQPTMRTGVPSAAIPLPSTTSPAANTTVLGYTMTSVTGALADFVVAGILSSNPPRIHFKVTVP